MDIVLGVLLRDVVTLDFAAADDGAEWLVDILGRVARVAAPGGMLCVSALRRRPRALLV